MLFKSSAIFNQDQKKLAYCFKMTALTEACYGHACSGDLPLV